METRQMYVFHLGAQDGDANHHTAQVQSLATEANVQYSPAVVLLVLRAVPVLVQ